MRSAASDKVFLLVLASLAILSLWLKEVTRRADVELPPGKLEQTIEARLVAQHFAVRERHLPLGGVVIEGTRDGCRLAARNGAIVVGSEANLAATTAGIGPLSYLYAGRRTTARPTVRMRLDSVRRQALHLFGFAAPPTATVALAASSACGDAVFGLADIQLSG